MILSHDMNKCVLQHTPIFLFFHALGLYFIYEYFLGFLSYIKKLLIEETKHNQNLDYFFKVERTLAYFFSLPTNLSRICNLCGISFTVGPRFHVIIGMYGILYVNIVDI